MLTVARRAHPDIRFEEGRLNALPFADGSLVGAVCCYSIIHTPPEHLREVFSELQRVLSDGGHVLVAFQAGDSEAVHRADAYGTGHSLTYYRHCPEEVARSLVEAGLKPHAKAVREPELANESTPQAFIIARNIEPGR
jgi:ubiquinone/menaquinone biosynthesis C-methylase UbiE